MTRQEQVAMPQELLRFSHDVELSVESEDVGRALRDARATGLEPIRIEEEILNELPVKRFR